MSIPAQITINKGSLPPTPGVYLMRDKRGEIIYVGKATSLKSRVSSYFHKAHDGKTEALVSEIAHIDYQETASVLEALILESELIKRHQPKYNVKEKSDKSWLYLTFSKDPYPRLELIRGLELAKMDNKQFKYIFGPYQGKKILQSILDIIRKIIPFSTCVPNQGKPCFYYQINRCPGVCIGAVTPREYQKTVRQLALIFQNKKPALVRELKKEMTAAAQNQDFETATRLRNQIYKLEHIQDVALLQKEEAAPSGDFPFPRVEGYDVSNISGTAATGAMVVAEGGALNKSQYRKFKVHMLNQISDTGMLAEVLTRRFHNSWPYPDLIMIDGGLGQVNAALKVLKDLNLEIPVVGLAKGRDRKGNRLILAGESIKLKTAISKIKPLLIRLRDEAHRFAISFHRRLRSHSLKSK